MVLRYEISMGYDLVFHNALKFVNVSTVTLPSLSYRSFFLCWRLSSLPDYSIQNRNLTSPMSLCSVYWVALTAFSSYHAFIPYNSYPSQ